MVITIRIPVPADKKLALACINRCLAFLQSEDEHQLREDPSLPGLDETVGVEYIREPIGQEEFLTLREVYERGGGDCEGLAAGQAATEVVRRKRRAKAFCRPSRVGYHCQVENDQGIEDTSRERGM
jgi:hypothetical protein